MYFPFHHALFAFVFDFLQLANDFDISTLRAIAAAAAGHRITLVTFVLSEEVEQWAAHAGNANRFALHFPAMLFDFLHLRFRATDQLTRRAVDRFAAPRWLARTEKVPGGRLCGSREDECKGQEYL